ncbi:VrrA/YqfQ family protein [Paenisporosarcina cavernae]|uniref:VrrA/YqfQ family protein n=1 Tax=Paenisporosarcina cavernae TaxID=2320858 RepID=UPI0013C43F59|nr:VrrA/YqfQ family protein [Paenisporosarcina cavernae]
MRYASFYPFSQSTTSLSRNLPPVGRGLNMYGAAAAPSKLDQYMQVADKVLALTQQLSPVVKQVSPMVQNLPALLSMYKGFSNLPDAASSTAANVAQSSVARPKIYSPK